MKKRSSGILMHITSLPGDFGIGTFGKSAYEFVDFLEETKQTYWQILPLTTTSYGDSPYQSFSAVAGNLNLIDFSLLKEDGNVILSTYKPREASFNISLDTLAPQDALNLNNWKNSIVLMEFPKDVVDISNISLNGTRVNIAGYEIFDKDGKKFLKAYLKTLLGDKKNQLYYFQKVVFHKVYK